MLRKESHLFASVFLILLVSFFSATDSFQKNIDDAELNSLQSEQLSLQESLQGKTYGEMVDFLQERYGEENVLPLSGAGQELITGKAVQGTDELWNKIKAGKYDKLPQAGQNDIKRWIRLLGQDWERGCTKLLKEREVFGKWSKRIKKGGKIDRPTFTGDGSGNGLSVSKGDAGIVFDIIEIINDHFKCKNREPPQTKPPVTIPTPQNVPAYQKEKWWNDQQKYRVPTNQYPDYRPGIPVSGEELTPNPISGFDPMPILVYTAGALILIILIICGLPYVLPILAAAQAAFTSLVTTEAAAVGGTAVLALMLASQAGAQPISASHIASVQFDINQNRNLGQSYFQNKYLPNNCGSLTPLSASTSPYFNDFFIPPDYAIDENPVTGGTIDCSKNPSALQALTFFGNIPLTGQQLPYLSFLFVVMDSLTSPVPNVRVVSATPGIRIGQDIPNTIGLNQPFVFDTANFCSQVKAGIYSFDITLQLLDPQYSLCNLVKVSGSITCILGSSSVFTDPNFALSGSGYVQLTPPVVTPGTQLESEQLCSINQPLQQGYQCKDDCSLKGQLCKTGCSGCVPLTVPCGPAGKTDSRQTCVSPGTCTGQNQKCDLNTCTCITTVPPTTPATPANPLLPGGNIE